MAKIRRHMAAINANPANRSAWAKLYQEQKDLERAAGHSRSWRTEWEQGVLREVHRLMPQVNRYIARNRGTNNAAATNAILAEGRALVAQLRARTRENRIHKGNLNNNIKRVWNSIERHLYKYPAGPRHLNLSSIWYNLRNNMNLYRKERRPGGRFAPPNAVNSPNSSNSNSNSNSPPAAARNRSRTPPGGARGGARARSRTPPGGARGGAGIETRNWTAMKPNYQDPLSLQNVYNWQGNRAVEAKIRWKSSDGKKNLSTVNYFQPSLFNRAFPGWQTLHGGSREIIGEHPSRRPLKIYSGNVKLVRFVGNRPTKPSPKRSPSPRRSPSPSAKRRRT